MLDLLFCYGVVANMIYAGYFGLVADLFRKVWSTRRYGVAAASAALWRRAGRALTGNIRGDVTQRMARLETYVTSMT